MPYVPHGPITPLHILRSATIQNSFKIVHEVPQNVSSPQNMKKHLYVRCMKSCYRNFEMENVKILIDNATVLLPKPDLDFLFAAFYPLGSTFCQ